MAIIGMILLVVGGIISLVGGIMLLIVAFRTSIWWGLGTIFVPFVGLIFVIMNWAVAKRPFVISLTGTAVSILGILLGGLGSR